MSTVASTIPTNGVMANGQYVPVVNIIGFNTQTGDSDAPYNQTLIGDSSNNVVGNSTNPYMPSILPVYIPTLYSNVYEIQTNLIGVMDSTASDNRTYPTAYAVKNYVASQLGGIEQVNTQNQLISTSITTSFLLPNDNPSVNTIDGGNTVINNYSYSINGTIDLVRNGMAKIILNNTDLVGVLSTGTGITTSATMIITPTTGLFYVLGNSYTHYEFSHKGDMLDMLEYIDGGINYFFVKSYGGRFSNP
jgi:hypothetical protein